MNPYETPDSDLEGVFNSPPKKIAVVYLLIASSFVLFLIEEILYSIFVAEDILAIESYIFVPIWAGILFWVTTEVRKRKHNPKNTFLILAIIVSGMSLYDPLTPYSIYTGILESLCFLGVYYLLRQKEFVDWFGESA